MIDGKPTILISYSVLFQDELARPLAKLLDPFGFRTVLVGDEPLPPGIDSNPNSKVEWFFRNANMAVFLATPDDRLQSGVINPRQNIVDEHRLGQQLPHLSHRLLVFKARDVTLPSNINPAYEQLPVDDLDWIVSKIVDQARTWGVLPPTAEAHERVAPTSSEEGASGMPSAALPGGDDAAATAQAVAALNVAIAGLGGEEHDRKDLQRAELAIAGLAAYGRGTDTLGVHLANRLFYQRHRIRLRRRERLLLIQTYLRNTPSENVPGAFWIKDLSRRELTEFLLSLVKDDGDSAVQAQALLVLGQLHRSLSTEQARQLLGPLLRSDDSAVRAAAVDFIRGRRDRALRGLLDDSQVLEQDRHRVSQAAAALDLASKPSDAMTRYIADEYVRSQEIASDLLLLARRVRREVVLDALQSGVPDVRLLGVRMAHEKGLLAPIVGRGVIESDRSVKVRMAVIRSFLLAGEPVDFELFKRAVDKRDDDLTDLTGFDEQRALELDFCLRLPQEELEAGVRWTGVHGPSCYEALGIRDEQWAKRNVRRDLRDDFTGLTRAAREEMLASTLLATEANVGRPLTDQEVAAAGEAVDEAWKPWSQEEKLGKFSTRLFTRAALRVLVATGGPADVRFARRFASSGDQDLRSEALRLFGRFGTSRDAAKVVGLVEQVYDETLKREGAETALRLAYKKDKLGTLKALREVRSLSGWSVERLADIPRGVDEAWRLLRSEDAEVRLAAAKVVWDAVLPQHADALLSLYMEGWHFYNVVRAVDRRLYSSSWLRDALPDG